jgi:O-antigen/teichoic acid export membrane protein
LSPRTLWRRPLGKTFIASGAIQALNVVTGVLLARSLGPHGRGELAAIMLWTILVVTLGSLGLPEALTYEIATDRERARRAIGTVVQAWTILSPVLVIFTGGVLTLTLSSYDVASRTNGYLMLVGIPLYLAAALCMAALQGLRAFGVFNMVRTLLTAGPAASLIALAALHDLTVRSAVLSYVAGYFVTAIIGLLLLGRTPFWSIVCERITLRRMLAYGIRSQSTFMASTLIERLDQLMISLLLGATSLGLYAVGFTLSSATTVGAYTLSLVAFPHVAALPEGPARAASARRFVLVGAATSAIIVMPMLAFTPQLLSLFFGSAFVQITDVARVLLLATVFSAGTQVLVALLRGLGRPLDAGAAGVVGLTLAFVLLAILLPTLGLMGAAVASLLAYVVTAWWMLRKVCSALGLGVTQFLRSPAWAGA